MSCSQMVTDSTGFHRYPCSRKATVTRDEKPYCTQHDPDRRAAKLQARLNAATTRVAREQQKEAANRALIARLGAGRCIYMPSPGSGMGGYLDGVFLSPNEVEELLAKIGGQP